jgi:hypothetical protein
VFTDIVGVILPSFQFVVKNVVSASAWMKRLLFTPARDESRRPANVLIVARRAMDWGSGW